MGDMRTAQRNIIVYTSYVLSRDSQRTQPTRASLREKETAHRNMKLEFIDPEPS